MSERGLLVVSVCVVFLMLSGGCRPCRRTLRESTFFSQDSIRAKRQDRVAFSSLKLSALQTGLTIRQIDFFPPDSLSRQFVRSVTILEKKQLAEEKEVHHLSGQTTEEIVCLQQEERNEHTENLSRSNSSGRWIKGLLFVLAGVLLFFRFRK